MDFIDIQYTVYVYKKLKQYLNRKKITQLEIITL